MDMYCRSAAASRHQWVSILYQSRSGRHQVNHCIVFPNGHSGLVSGFNSAANTRFVCKMFKLFVPCSTTSAKYSRRVEVEVQGKKRRRDIATWRRMWLCARSNPSHMSMPKPKGGQKRTKKQESFHRDKKDINCHLGLEYHSQFQGLKFAKPRGFP
jgi:hypothetical protein